MVSNQEDLTTRIKDISPKQVDDVYGKRHESSYNKVSLTAG